jgi:hypothetical protein
MSRFALELHVTPNERPLHVSAELDDEPVPGQLIPVEGYMWRVWGVRPTRSGRSWSDLFVCALEQSGFGSRRDECPQRPVRRS